MYASKKSNVIRVLITVVVIVIAVLVVAYEFRDYFKHPWTRDGQVRAQVIQIAPRITGPIVELPIEDNQEVKKGDLLFKIDPSTYEAALAQAQANLTKAETHAQEAVEEARQYRESYEKSKGAIALINVNRREAARDSALAAVEAARAALQSAELDLKFTEVRAPVDGYLTNLNLRTGSQMVANQPALALIDTNSFWVHGFFKETQVGRIKPGDKVVVKLMTYPDQPVEGVVESIGWGISQQDGSPGNELLPNTNPTFDWIRLAQRIPVRVKLTDVPDGVELRVGTTGSVFVDTGR